MVSPLWSEDFAVTAVFQTAEPNHGTWIVASAGKDDQVGLHYIPTPLRRRGRASRTIFVQRTQIERIANFDSESRCARFGGNRDNYL
jgi:hypothetical protein